MLETRNMGRWGDLMSMSCRQNLSTLAVGSDIHEPLGAIVERGRHMCTLETKFIQSSSFKESEMELLKNIPYNPGNVQINT
jgi:hypothetical protein